MYYNNTLTYIVSKINNIFSYDICQIIRLQGLGKGLLFQWVLICRKSNLFCFLSQMTVGGNLFEIFHDGILLKFPQPRWRHMLEWGVNIIYLSVYISLLGYFSGFCFIFIPELFLDVQYYQ